MVHFESKKWRIFASRPTSILKRDFMKWAYLSVGKIKGFKLSKVLAIGNDQEMDIYVDYKEDQRNYSRIAEQCRKGELKKVLKLSSDEILFYQPKGEDAVGKSLRAMKDIGPLIIYSYYVEGLLSRKPVSEETGRQLEVNSRLRDSGAKIIYPLYDKARTALLEKSKNKGIDHLTLDELKRAPEKTAIRQRKEFYVFLGTAKGSSIYTGGEAKKFLDKEKFTRVKSVSKTELVGLSAGHGSVRGRVKIIRGIKDIKNCSGKVIVSRETIIEYTPMLKKNLAIVTDLGGISSHAAMTARELNIPCVVGTKHATEVFKDGDLVEVDADKGEVKIIKRAGK